MNSEPISAAIVDYRLGNLFSVRAACAAVGVDAEITDDAAKIAAADAIILPGVGAFADAMKALTSLGLDAVLRDAAAFGTPMMGVCLGLQLFMTASEEFGNHPGLGLVDGVVTKLKPSVDAQGRAAKIPHVGWSRVSPPGSAPGGAKVEQWQRTPLADVEAGAFMYFVHSFVVAPSDSSMVLTETSYGGLTFCTALGRGNLFGCQFHPERSGPVGLQMYRRFAAQVQGAKEQRQ